MIPFIVPCCPVCRSNEQKQIHQITYRSDRVLQKLGIISKPIVHLVQCKNCQHHFVNPRLNKTFINRYYSEINSEFYDFGEGIPEDNNNYNHNNLIIQIEKIKKGGKILDIGCGYGFLLDKFDKTRWERHGIEPSPHAFKYLARNNGLSIIHGYLDKQTYSEGTKFDVILLMDVIEHLSEPDELLATVDYYLDPDGMIVIGTGNIKSLNAMICQKHWAYLGIYEHISFFSPASIRELLMNNGFIPTIIKSVSYQKSFKANLIRLFKNLILSANNYLFRSKTDIVLPIALDHMIIYSQKNR